jgi:predicted enzyme related to lactoylglutathione lyase
MSERKELLPGSFCWPELATPDLAKAKSFFSSLFGWEPVDVPSAGGTYTIFKLRGLDVAAARSFSHEECGQKIPTHFMNYVSASSVDAAAERAKALGGKVLYGPFDVEGIGRMAVASDPEGLAFAIWEARGHIGIRLAGEPGSLCWTEIVTRDPEGAKAFYGGLFGWTFQAPEGPMPEYIEIHRGEQPIGGVFPMKGDEWTGVPGHFMPYFAVADCDAAFAKAKELGGGAVVPPTDIPNVGRFSLLRDDQGAHFSVITFGPMPSGA